MPRGRLSERYVQKAAIKWLTSYYGQSDIQVVVSEKEVRVKSKDNLGSGRADGLIVAQFSDGTIYTASLEAKSSKTIFNISPFYRDGKWLLHAVLVGVTGLILAGLVGWSVGGWFWACVFPLLAFVGVGFVYLMITYDYSHYRPIDVIAQVKRYPANEQWLAISTDVYNQLGQEQGVLHKDCQKEGIGLIRVSAGQLVTLLEAPRAQSLPRGYQDYLACYAREKVIRAKLLVMKSEKSQEDVT